MNMNMNMNMNINLQYTIINKIIYKHNQNKYNLNY